MERLEAVSYGRVQMVMYRDFVQRHARGLGLVGEVANKEDGTVRTVAEGPRASLDRLVTKLNKGPLLAQVERVEVRYAPATETYREFSIAY